MAQVHGEVCVAIPPESQALKSPPRKPYTVTRVALLPAVRRVALELAGPHGLPLRPFAHDVGPGRYVASETAELDSRPEPL